MTKCISVNELVAHTLTSPTSMPQAGGFLWNKHMLVQANCRGYATAQYMQDETSKYTSGPMLEAKTFMQPEQPYYTHHPGRFFYVKDEQSGALFSAPYEPVRAELQHYAFVVEPHKLSWTVESLDVRLTMTLTLAADQAVELWTVDIENLTQKDKNLSLYPYFPVGYRSWMNQSGAYDQHLQGIVASCITPYQKVEDYFNNRDLKDLTFLLSDTKPQAWEASQQAFEGEGGLHNPSAIQRPQLKNGSANYQTPAAIMQFQLTLTAYQTKKFRFLFGPAKDKSSIDAIRQQFFADDGEGFENSAQQYKRYINAGKGCLQVSSPDKEFDRFVNHWLPRQMYYHGDVNRLTSDPQTRNYLQDNMGMTYIQPSAFKDAFMRTLSQQHRSGEMPDGILLHDKAQLKYINQIPHTDHCVWLPICLQAYLDETADYALLHELVGFKESHDRVTVFEHVQLAMLWLENSRDQRGLSYINQGDWCDPMNMVGYKGVGVSGWLTLASAYAFVVWSDVCKQIDDEKHASYWLRLAQIMNEAANKYLWHEDRFARGITDEGRTFGTELDEEGKIFLNPQSWAMLSGAADEEQISRMVNVIEDRLFTPFGPMMLAPSYTNMVEDIGRVTQKSPGTAENGSVYNHAAIFYVFSLYKSNRPDTAFSLLKAMLPNHHDMMKRGQLPVYIPNYYRGAYYQFPIEAGRSSQLFNTGTVAWYYRTLVEHLFGLLGCKEGLIVAPNLPTTWTELVVVREFRGATFTVRYSQRIDCNHVSLWQDGCLLKDNCVREIRRGEKYLLDVWIPVAQEKSDEE